MLKSKLLEQFLAGVWGKGRGLTTTLALILASTWIPRAHAQQVGISVDSNPACPGTTVGVSVTAYYYSEGDAGGLAVMGCTITNTDGATCAYGYLTMSDSDNEIIEAWDNSSDSFNSLTVLNSANIPATTNSTPGAGTIISNGVLSPTDFILCGVGSGIANPPQDAGTVVSGKWITNIISSCSNIISSNVISVPYTQGDTYFTWTSNGVLVTNLPAAFADAGSYSFEGYVHFIPPAGFPYTNVIPVDLGTLTVCVFSFANTCTPGSVSLANTSECTNYILGDAPSLSAATTNATDAALEFITNCPCDSSLDADVTSNLPPTIILSNWWTVSGPGATYTNTGSGLSTGSLSPIPTNGGTGTATFYVSYSTWTNSANSAPWCCTNTNSLQVPFNVLQMMVTNLVFGGGLHTVYQDANAQPYPSIQWTTNTSYPVCYTAGTNMTVTPTFSVTPSAFPLPVVVQGISSGPLLPVTTNSISGSNLALTITSSNNFSNKVEFLNPMTIDWKYSCDYGTNWCDAGTSTNRVYVTLNNPQAPILFHTVVYLACANPGATDTNTAAANTWSFFKGPSNVVTWDTNKLYYYQAGTPWANEVWTVSGLLATGNGQCNSWRQLLESAWLANGIMSQVARVNATNSATQQPEYLVGNNWTFPTNGSLSNNPPYNYLLDLTLYGSNGFTMVPQPTGGYGDLQNGAGAAGQNSPTPAEKVFIQHFIQKFNGLYYDPSYGLTYTNSADFQSQAIAGFALKRLDTNGNRIPNVMAVKKATSTVEIHIVP